MGAQPRPSLKEEQESSEAQGILRIMGRQGGDPSQGMVVVRSSSPRAELWHRPWGIAGLAPKKWRDREGKWDNL